LNNFERHLKNGHTQTLRHIEPPSNIDKTPKKKHSDKSPLKKSTNRDKEIFNDLETSIDTNTPTQIMNLKNQ
jgi:hypothetical protein